MSLATRLRSAARVLLADDARTDAAPVVRADATFANPETGLGVEGIDVSLGARPRWRAPLSRAERDEGYRRGGYFRRIVDLLPAESTRCGWSVNLSPETESDPTKARDALRDEDRRLRVRHVMRTADSMARLHGGALVLMVTSERKGSGSIGLVGRNRYAEPLDPSRVVEVRALHVFTRDEATVYKWNEDPTSPDYRAPEVWQITPRTGSVEGLGAGALVHASRVVYLPGHELPPHLRLEEDGFDDPVIEAYRDAIADKEAIDRAGALAASRLEVAILKVKGLADKKGSDLDGFFARKMRTLARSWSSLGVMLIGEGDEFTRQGFTATGFENLSANAQTACSAVEGIPITVMFGEAPGGLTTDNESGRQTFDRIVAARQINVYDPALSKVYAVILWSKGYKNPRFSIDFAPLHEPTEKEVAEVKEIEARTLASHVGIGSISADEVRSNVFGKPGSDFVLDDESDDTATEPALGASSEVDVARQAFTGIQITALFDAARAVEKGEVSKPFAIEALKIAFPTVDPGSIDRAFATIEEGEPVETPPPVVPAAPGVKAPPVAASGVESDDEGEDVPEAVEA